MDHHAVHLHPDDLRELRLVLPHIYAGQEGYERLLGMPLVPDNAAARLPREVLHDGLVCRLERGLLEANIRPNSTPAKPKEKL